MGYLNDEPIGRIGGIDFYASAHLMIRDGDKKIKKSLRERFTWKFWEVYRYVPNMVPDRVLYRMEGKIIGHPETIKEAMRQVEGKKVSDVKG